MSIFRSSFIKSMFDENICTERNPLRSSPHSMPGPEARIVAARGLA